MTKPLPSAFFPTPQPDDGLADLRARVECPLAEARGFPNSAYSSERFLASERERIFARNWVLAGFTHQVPASGDVVAAEIAGLPILLWRRKDGSIAAYHNACRHRGAALVDQSCRGRSRLVCPYHAWTYDQAGRLVARPYFDGSHPKDQQLPADPSLNLRPVRIAQWQDLIFADLSGAAPPLEEALAPFTAAIADYDLSTCRHAGMLTFELEANWKLAAENFIESYHVFNAHPALVKFAPMRTRDPGRWDGKCFSTGYRFPQAEAGRGEGLPLYPGISEQLKTQGLWFLLYPNLGIQLWPDQFVVFRVMPLSATRTREEVHIYLMGEAAESPAYAAERTRVRDLWQDLNTEDLHLLESLQRGRLSPSYDGGVYSRQWEEPVLQFSRLLVRDLEAS